MRKFSGITNIHSPEAVSSNSQRLIQMMVIPENGECGPGRTGMKIQPYRTEFRNIYK